MKKVTFLFLIGIFITAVSFTSCKKVVDNLEDSIEVTVHTDLNVPMDIVPTETKGDPRNFNVTASLDPTQNSELSDYLDKIQRIEVEKIKLLVTRVSVANLIMRTGTFTLTDDVTGDSFTFNTPENFAIEVGTTFEIDNTTEGWETLTQIVNNLNPVTVSAVGSINNDPFDIGADIILPIKAVVKK